MTVFIPWKGGRENSEAFIQNQPNMIMKNTVCPSRKTDEGELLFISLLPLSFNFLFPFQVFGMKFALLGLSSEAVVEPSPRDGCWETI